MRAQFWTPVERGEVPVCSRCAGTLRPDVVFFGESLPDRLVCWWFCWFSIHHLLIFVCLILLVVFRFIDLRTADLQQCDLLIILGTSLVVYPFAGLVNEVSDVTPRLLINKKGKHTWNQTNHCSTFSDSLTDSLSTSTHITSCGSFQGCTSMSGLLSRATTR